MEKIRHYFGLELLSYFRQQNEFYKKKEGMRIAENKFIELVRRNGKNYIYYIIFSNINGNINCFIFLFWDVDRHSYSQ